VTAWVQNRGSTKVRWEVLPGRLKVATASTAWSLYAPLLTFGREHIPRIHAWGREKDGREFTGKIHPFGLPLRSGGIDIASVGGQVKHSA